MFSRVGAGTAGPQRQGGGAINAHSTEERVRLIELDGEEYLFYKAFPIDVAFIRGTTAEQEQIAARVDLFDHRVPEEAYEVKYDPDALTNLIAKPEHAAQVAMLEKAQEDQGLEWSVERRRSRERPERSRTAVS